MCVCVYVGDKVCIGVLCLRVCVYAGMCVYVRVCVYVCENAYVRVRV